MSEKNDLISRQAVIDYLVLNMGWHDEDGYPVDDTEEKRGIITELLSGIPSAEPVRHGKWREYPISDGMNQCSECGVLRFGKSNYCPNCGCRMDVE